MNASSRYPAREGTAGTIHGGAAATAVPAGRACCCPATAVIRVVMPPTQARPHDTELLLCGHHYRISRPVLAAAHAAFSEVPVAPGVRPAALLPDPPGALCPLLGTGRAPAAPGRTGM
jgi:hypothetical protein